MAMTLRVARRRKRLTQDQLAERSGVDQTHISGLETGRRGPSQDVRERLADALGVSPAELLFGRRPAATVDRLSDRAGQAERPTEAHPSTGDDRRTDKRRDGERRTNERRRTYERRVGVPR